MNKNIVSILLLSLVVSMHESHQLTAMHTSRKCVNFQDLVSHNMQMVNSDDESEGGVSGFNDSEYKDLGYTYDAYDADEEAELCNVFRSNSNITDQSATPRSGSTSSSRLGTSSRASSALRTISEFSQATTHEDNSSRPDSAMSIHSNEAIRASSGLAETVEKRPVAQIVKDARYEGMMMQMMQCDREFVRSAGKRKRDNNGDVSREDA